MESVGDVPSRGLHQRFASCAIEKLRPRLLVKVLEYVDLSARVRFASSSHLLEYLVYTLCPSLWVRIEFGAAAAAGGTGSTDQQAEPRRSCLTDEMLASLLARVNARNVTQTLSVLCETPNLTGLGLMPLIYSRVLENVYMELPYCFDETCVVRILRTMIPFKLFQVRFGCRLLSYAPDTLTGFLYDLGAARISKAKKQNIACFSCDAAVVNESRLVVPKKTGLASMRCDGCQNHFCRHGACSMQLTDCSRCGQVSCDDCAQISQCFTCSEFFCAECDPCEVGLSATRNFALTVIGSRAICALHTRAVTAVLEMAT